MRRNLARVLLGSVMATALAVAGLLGAGIWKRVSSPGPMSSGHADLACKECHVGVNASDSALNQACLDCHRDEMATARHAHSPVYFEIVTARRTPWYLSPTACLDCHRGHQRQVDSRVTTFIPDRFCVACHADVQKRVSGPGFVTDHKTFDFSTCQGCHQFHERTLFPPQPGDQPSSR